MSESRLRDIDYAARAVGKAVREKFGKDAVLDQLEIVAGERTIRIRDGQRMTENTRDNLLAAIRRAVTYETFWNQFPLNHRNGESDS